MKLSVSLPDDDVAFLDRYASEQGIDSRSAAVQKAIRLLRASELGSAYEQAWADWTSEDTGSDTGSDTEERLWNAVAGDGIS